MNLNSHQHVANNARPGNRTQAGGPQVSGEQRPMKAPRSSTPPVLLGMKEVSATRISATYALYGAMSSPRTQSAARSIRWMNLCTRAAAASASSASPSVSSPSSARA